MNTENEGAAVHTVLASYFAVRQLEATAAGYLYGAVAPTLVLWVNAWHPLSEIMTWLAVLGWAMCVFLTVMLAALARERRLQLFAALPEARRIAHFHFAPDGDALPRASTILIGLATAASVFLWLHGLAPSL